MEKQYIYATAANGITVRIPAEKYEAWKKAQDEIRAGRKGDTSQTAKQLRSIMEKK